MAPTGNALVGVIDLVQDLPDLFYVNSPTGVEKLILFNFLSAFDSGASFA